MKAVWAMSLLCGLLASPHVRAWTYTFYISGDFDYNGPTWAKDRKDSALEDQAQVLFERALDLARRDKLNDYAIYYDPRGGPSGWWFSKIHSQTYVYSRGVLLNESSQGETDSASVQTAQNFFDRSQAILRKARPHEHSPQLLYYYGEHVAKNPGALDESHPQTLFGINQLASLVEAFVSAADSIQILLLHSCYMGTISTLHTLMPALNGGRLLVPTESISNSALNLEPLTGAKTFANAASLADSLIAAQDLNQYQHQLQHFWMNADMGQFLRDIRAIETKLDPKDFNADVLNTYQQRSTDLAQHPVVDLSLSHELLLSVEDYIDLLATHTTDFAAIESLRARMAATPALKKLKQILEIL